MKITRVEVYKIGVPYIPPVKKSIPQPRLTLILEVHTDEGIVGLGEDLGSTEAEIRSYAFSLLGKDPFQLNLAQLPLPMPARVAYEQALYDLAGKRLGIPVCRPLGGPVRDKVPLAYWSHEMSVEDTVSEAEAAVEGGFKVYKFKAWTPNAVVERMRALNKAVGDELAIRLDANTAWHNPAQAIKLIRQLEGYNIKCLEGPVPYNLDWYDAASTRPT